MSDGKKKKKKTRLDALVLDRGLAPSRERAKSLILAGKVLIAGHAATKAGTMVAANADVKLKEADHPYVSRGGLKLARALEVFDIDVTGLVGLDVGASTGGFTDVLLRGGASRVFAIDVGYGQLDWSLRNDERVVVLERENIRHLDADKITSPADIAVIDVSFIALSKILAKVAELLGPGKPIVCLVKPQFEVGKGKVGKGGVVRDPELRESAIGNVIAWAEARGFITRGRDTSPITGPAGNVELLLHLETPTG